MKSLRFNLLACSASLVAIAGLPGAAHGQSDAPGAAEAVEQADAEKNIDDIVVTARRRSESAQRVPISITALSADKLETATVKSLNDLTTLAPGLRMSSEGGGGVSTISLRGLAKTPVGETLPAVVIYFAEVALPNQGVDVPIYDLGNVQVLKGPQGTLFGRNAIGGAILMSPRAPTYDLNGYVRGTLGDFMLRELEGAVNIPIIDGSAALRVAGIVRRRDGVVKVTDGPDARNIHQESFRASLLLEPTAGLTNTTIVDYFNADERSNPAIVYKNQIATFIPTLTALINGQNASGRFPSPLSVAGYVEALNAAVDRQLAQGPFTTQQAIPDLYTRRKSLGVVNTTRFDLSDDIYIKNIFGWRKSKIGLTSNSDGLPLIIPTSGFAAPLDVLTGGLFAKRELLSNELQLQGSAFGNTVNFIVGGIYSQDKPVGAPNGNFGPRFQFGGPLAPSAFGPALSSFITSKSRAVFGQITVDLSKLGVEGLKVNAGYRHTWDKVKACGTAKAITQFVDEDQCVTDLAGLSYIKAKDSEPSYTLGLDWQATQDILLYAVHRRGFRAANVNAPLFTTNFTTGGLGCISPPAPAGGQCPDLRPFQTTKPEKVNDVELGIKTNWSAGSVRGRFNLSAYQLKLKGLVQFLQSADLGVPSSAPDRPQSGSLGVNLADQTVRGVEIDAAIMPFDGLTLTANGAYVKHKVDAVNFPSIGNFNFNPASINKPTPKFSGTVSAQYTTAIDPQGTELVLYVDYYHSTSYRPQSGIPLPGYNVANGRIDIRNIAGRNVDFGFWMKNIGNEKYLDAPIVLSPAFPVATGLFGERRTFGVDLRFRFGS